MGMFIFLVLLAIIIILIVITNIRVVPQTKAFVIERLGTYTGTWHAGLHVKVPLIDKVSKVVSLKEQVIDFPPQPVITKDNVTMEIDTVVFFAITDPKLYTYGVEYPIAAIENLTATTLRNIIGDLELDESLTSREHINSRIRIVLDEATDPWGIKINRVEVKNITPPKDIQTAMEKQMRAERERRESILRAEGEKKSAILIAEGNKESTILEAQASKEKAIMEAEGKAEAIRMVQKANADGIKMLNEADPHSAVIDLKALSTLEKMGDGKATKIIVPTEIASIAGLTKSIMEIAKDEPENK